jgi:uncharacterized membrane protein
MSRHILSPGEAWLDVGVGLAVGVAAGGIGSPSLAPLAAWCTAGIIALVQVWRRCWPQDPAGTEQLAREESESRLTDNAVIVACLASVAAMVLALIESHNAGDLTSVLEVVLGVVGTMVAWALVNTVFALKYARMYFLDQRADGLNFQQEKAPTYSDFAYFAFTIGMSYATSEIEPTDTETRRKALPHALLSYFFGTVLIAVAINLVTNIGQS